MKDASEFTKIIENLTKFLAVPFKYGRLKAAMAIKFIKESVINLNGDL